jgi:hypothetical protein
LGQETLDCRARLWSGSAGGDDEGLADEVRPKDRYGASKRMSLGQGHYAGLLPERKPAQAWFVMRPKKNRNIYPAATRVAEKLRAIALDPRQVEPVMSPDEPQQGVAESPRPRPRSRCQ